MGPHFCSQFAVDRWKWAKLRECRNSSSESLVNECLRPREISRAADIAEDTGSAKDRLWVFVDGDELCHIRHTELPILLTVLLAKGLEVCVTDPRQTEMSKLCEQHSDSDNRRVAEDDDTCEMFGHRPHRSPASRRA